MILLAHITAVGSAAFLVPVVTVIALVAFRQQDQSDLAEARRRRARAVRATVRERWTLERRDGRWVLVDVQPDAEPGAHAVPSPWAFAGSAPSGNGHGPSPEALREMVAGLTSGEGA